LTQKIELENNITDFEEHLEKVGYVTRVWKLQFCARKIPSCEVLTLPVEIGEKPTIPVQREFRNESSERSVPESLGASCRDINGG
jgi:hypothetical protein